MGGLGSYATGARGEGSSSSGNGDDDSLEELVRANFSICPIEYCRVKRTKCAFVRCNAARPSSPRAMANQVLLRDPDGEGGLTGGGSRRRRRDDGATPLVRWSASSRRGSRKGECAVGRGSNPRQRRGARAGDGAGCRRAGRASVHATCWLRRLLPHPHVNASAARDAAADRRAAARKRQQSARRRSCNVGEIRTRIRNKVARRTYSCQYLLLHTG